MNLIHLNGKKFFNMNLSDEQLNFFCSSILLSDIAEYIKSHQKEYEEFEKNEKNKLE